MSDRQELSGHHWDKVAEALRTPTAEEFFLRQTVQMRLEVPNVMPIENMTDEVLQMEKDIRIARIAEDTVQLELIHSEQERRQAEQQDHEA